jgi:hypothetical protein
MLRDVDSAPAIRTVPEPELARRGRVLLQVLALAEALPTRHEPDLRFPRLPTPTPR